MDNEDYLTKFNSKIEYAKYLNSIKPENLEKAISLINKKKAIMEKNSFFADWQLKRINRKLDKLKI